MKRLAVLAFLAITASCGGDPPAPPVVPPPPSVKPAASTAPPEEPAPPPPQGLRLPHTAAPQRVVAKLTVIPGEPTVQGEIDLDLTFAEPLAALYLHAREITVKDASLIVGGVARPARVVPGGEDMLGFTFARAPAGAVRLHVTYVSRVSQNDDRGLFQETEDGAPYVFTQFENIDARRVFPCFDDPGYKIPWQLSLEIPEGQTALSNTPVTAETPAGPGRKLVRFAETKPLPSYLVAFAVGPFELVDAGKVGEKGTPVRIAVPRGRRGDAAYAAKTTPELLSRLEAFFGVPYPYEKLDVVPIPHLVSFGAMENAGMITFTMPGMLASPAADTVSFERGYADTITHEMAHQWFGDLVTMAFWDDVWLNEAFATWMEAKILVPWKPSWGYDASRERGTSGAMNEDSLVSARKIRQEVTTKDDIQNAFDGITYQKGAAVIGMFENLVGAEPFRKGVKRYLTAHAYGNATAADFLAAVSAEAKRDVGPAFSTFLDQPGVPLVHAELRCDKGKDARLELSQERFLPVGTTGSGKQTWQIPVCARFSKGGADAEACTLLDAPTGALTLPSRRPACPDWVLPNAGASGYYHVAYTPAALTALFGKGYGKLGRSERISLVRDLSALVRSGKLPVADALSRVPELIKDPDPDMQRAVVGLVNLIPDQIVEGPLRPRFTHFVNQVFGPAARALGFRPKAGEDDRVRLLRPLLVTVAADEGEDAALLAEASKLARGWLDDPTSLEEDSIDPVVRIAANHGDRALFDRLRAELGKAKEDRRRRHLLGAMASFRDPAIVNDSLALYLDGGLDAREGVHLLFQDRRSTGLVFAFLKQRFDALAARLPGELRGDLPYFVGNFCSEAERADMKAFFEPRVATLTGGTRNLAETLEGIALCSAFRGAQQASLESFLKKY